MRCICFITASVSDLNSHMGGEKHCPIIRFQVASRAESALAFLSQFETINNIKPYFVKHKFVLNVYFPDDCII